MTSWLKTIRQDRKQAGSRRRESVQTSEALDRLRILRGVEIEVDEARRMSQGDDD
jgi:hypothetical protein